MLQVDNLHAYYGKSHVLHGVSFEVAKGEIVALLGRNGSGRSTTAKAIMGLVDCTGDIVWKGRQLAGLRSFEVAHAGIGYVPENRDIFPTLSVHQNLLLGQKRSGKPSQWGFEDMYNMFPRLRERQHTEAGVLSGGEQQMLAMGRALMSRPKVLLLDEPSMGLSPLMVDKVFEVVRDVFAQGVTVLLVEQNASRALAIANRGYVMESGLISMTGLGQDLLNDPKVRAAYLGE